MKDSAGLYDTTESGRLFEKAQFLMPGGVSHESRHPVYIERAVGSRKWDVDGNEYVDYSMGSAALLLGHAHPDVTKAISETAPMGTYYSNWSGHLIRVPEDALQPGRSPVVEIRSKEPMIVTRLSEDPFQCISKALMVAADLDLAVNF